MMAGTTPKMSRGLAYLKSHGIEDFLERILSDIGKMCPDDPYAYILQVLTKKMESHRKHRDRINSLSQDPSKNEVHRNVLSFVRAWGHADDECSQAHHDESLLGFDTLNMDSYDNHPIFTWEYDVVSKSDSQLLTHATSILNTLDISNQFAVNGIVLQNFLVSVCKNYRTTNAYHNFKHAYSVMLGTALLLQGGSRAFTDDIEAFALLVAALCHDVGHPGVNNDYFVKARHALAYRYNDSAVLENMHAALMFELMTTPRQNICKDLPADEWLTFRRAAIAAILATDMKMHSELTSRLDDLGSLGLAADANDEILAVPEYRSLIQKCIVHAADLSNPILPTELSKDWAKRVVIEFYQQAETEKRENLPFAPFMNHHPDDTRELARLQIGFINFIVKPFWSGWLGIFPEIQPQYIQLELNLQYWSDVKASFDEKKDASQVAEKQASSRAHNTGDGSLVGVR